MTVAQGPTLQETDKLGAGKVRPRKVEPRSTPDACPAAGVLSGAP